MLHLPIKPTLVGLIKLIGPRSNHSISGPHWKREAEDSICGSVAASGVFSALPGRTLWASPRTEP